MFLSSLLLTSFLQVAVVPPQAPREPDHHLVAVRIRDARTIERLLQLDLDLAGESIRLPVREIEVIAEDYEIEKIKNAGLDYRVVVRNLEATIGKQLSAYQFPDALTPPVGQGAMGGHYTLDQIVAILDQFAQNHPTLCTSKVSLGKSHEARDIWMVKISDNVQQDEDEPEVLFDAIHHAREPLSATTTLLFMDWLLENYGKDPEATFLVDNRELFFVPCMNPDGYEYNRANSPNGGGMWRKNRRDNGGGVYGVDINRNWPTGWNAPNGGNSTSPSSDTYRGPAPASEPEIAALDAFIKTRKFTLGHSCHTYTEILLYPWGYQNGGPANEADYRQICQASLAKNAMSYGPVSTSLYIAAGAATDHYHAAYGMYGFTAELGTSSEGGFWPNPANTVIIANRHQHMFKTFARLGGAYVGATSWAAKEAPGGNGNGRIEPGEQGELRLVIDNDGAVGTKSSVIVTAKSLTTGVTFSRATHDFGPLAKFSGANNDTAPLVFKVDNSFPGVRFDAELALQFDSTTLKAQISVGLATPFTVIGTEFERDLGFRRATTDTATTGLFERAVPQRTTSSGRDAQPGADHSPNGVNCWVTDSRAGSSAGSYDVDGGKTSFLSPVIDLRHVELPQLAVWVYYTETVANDDPFIIEMSRDAGQNWQEIYRRTASTNGWERIVTDLPGTMTDRMQFRFTAQDMLTPSVVEACVDDLEVLGLVNTAAVTILGSGERTSLVRFAFRGAPTAFGVPLLAAATADIQIPGVEGKLLLDPASLLVLPAFGYGNDNDLRIDIPIPNDVGLVGKTFHWQQLFVRGTALKLGNRSAFTVQ